MARDRSGEASWLCEATLHQIKPKVWYTILAGEADN
jgi:hypothetical protein